MSAVEAAVYANLSERNLRRQAAEGVFPHIRIGRRVVFRRDTLDAALARLESKTKQKSPRRANARPASWLLAEGGH